MKNVLVFPCGSEVGLEINRALADSTHFCLYGASTVNDHGRFVYERYIGDVPFVDSPDFIDEINRIAALFHIDFIFPAHDSVLVKLAENQALLGAVVVASCAETCRLCRSKLKTYERFEKLIATPKVYREVDSMEYPVFLKPDVGQGSKGTYKVNTREEVEFYYKQDPSLLALEYLPGKEYTVDCFTDCRRRLLFAAGRERSRISNGISVHSRSEPDDRFWKMAEIINQTLLFRGVWFFQVKERVNGDFVLMEIAPRVAGTMALVRVAGVNLAQLSLFDRMGIDVCILQNPIDVEIDRALFSRFSISYEYSSVYVDLDDTIIVNNLVNTTMMKFLYQARNAGKKIVLLSRHEKSELLSYLEQFAISAALFDKIVPVAKGERKSAYIIELNSVFIDDSFAERKEVFDLLHIPVFSLDALEGLLQWKV